MITAPDAFDLAQTDALLTSTRAVRRRLDFDRPVEPEVIERCLELALQAPIGGNNDRRRWMIVTDQKLKDEIAALYRLDALPYLDGLIKAAQDAKDNPQQRVGESALFLAHNLQRAPVLVVPCASKVDLASNADAAGDYGSILPAVWSFQLALRARGLGSAWTTLHLGHEDQVAELLGIPDTVSQVALLPVAYTAGGEFRPARRPAVRDVAYWNGWLAPRTD